MRFEGKHKQFKVAARRGSLKNILLTLSRYHQRLMAYDLHYNTLFAAVKVSTGTGTLLEGPEEIPQLVAFGVSPSLPPLPPSPPPLPLSPPLPFSPPFPLSLTQM